MVRAEVIVSMACNILDQAEYIRYTEQDLDNSKTDKEKAVNVDCLVAELDRLAYMMERYLPEIHETSKYYAKNA